VNQNEIPETFLKRGFGTFEIQRTAAGRLAAREYLKKH
jgi:hypothetical protein